MSSELDERQVLRLAMAANGPVGPLPDGCSFTLEALQEIRWNDHLNQRERDERLEQVRRILRAMNNDADLEARLKAQGMFSVTDLLEGTPVDAWRAHTGINSLDTFENWLVMKRRQFNTMLARYEIGDKPKADELYEWVFAHSGVFADVHVNFKAMKTRMAAAEENKV